MAKKRHFPNLGDLSIAILESIVQPLIGENTIQVIKEPLKEKQLRTDLSKALTTAEKRFMVEFTDREICKAVLALPLANLSKLQEAVRDFYSRPSSTELQKLIKNQLLSDYPHLAVDRIEQAAEAYLIILRQELAQVSDDVRQKLVALATLEINQSLRSLLAGETLYNRFSDTPLLSSYIFTALFKTLVQERTQNFVGRDFVFRALDSLIQDTSFSSGYIVIRGEPGIGKTALVAELIRRRGYVHHFNLSLQNIKTSKDFLSNVCAQLIIRYQLNHVTLPPNFSNDGGFLSQLLDEVATKEESRPTVILVDALDEADDVGLPSEANILYLPQSLPRGIYFVLTTRETHDYHLNVDHQKDIYIQDHDPQNLDDVRQYIKGFIHGNQERMMQRLQNWNIAIDEFVSIMTEKSEGNFMYLVHVLGDMCEGKITKANLHDMHNLPRGLRGYYQRHWRMMKARDEVEFDKFQEPVICILATVHEPVTIRRVSEWTELDYRRIKDVINNWREFLNVDDTDGETLYRIYHASFQDFLKEEVGLTKYHEKIAMKILGKIPGFLDGQTIG